MFDHFRLPGTLMITGLPLASTSFCSTISCSESRPETSRNWPIVSLPARVSRKRLVGRGFCALAIPVASFQRWGRGRGLLLDLAGAGRELAEPEDDELGGL